MMVGVMATMATSRHNVGLGPDHSDAAAAVVPVLHVARCERCRLRTSRAGVGENCRQVN